MFAILQLLQLSQAEIVLESVIIGSVQLVVLASSKAKASFPIPSKPTKQYAEASLLESINRWKIDFSNSRPTKLDQDIFR